jgi:hypothetical protein
MPKVTRPTMIQVGAFDFQVLWQDEVRNAGGGDAFGHCDTDALTIRISTKYVHQQLADTLVHEVQITNQTSTWLTGVIRDNPLFAKFVQYRDPVVMRVQTTPVK